MSKVLPVVFVVLLVVTTTVTGTVPMNDVAATNEAPLAEAGLDQEVTKGATVLLDGTGSRDPDGRIERYDWSIRTPSGDAIAPNCSDCPRTRFEPTETGRYRVTLTVTDRDGATSSDTLYVDVSPGADPAVSISGPDQSTVGSTATYTANLDAGAAALDYVVWTVDGVVIANHTLAANQQSDAATKRFPTTVERTITATVYDVDGQSNADSLSVEVRNRADPSDRPPSVGTSLARRHSPTVSGDEVVTGTKPLRGNYAVHLEAATDSVASVQWRTTAGPVGSGRTIARTWEPGDHELYALVTYTDGSESVATFDGGTTTVVADPRPNVSFETLDRFGSISGTATSLDEYGNLDALSVKIDGKTVAAARPTLRGHRRFDSDRRRTVRFSHPDFTPGERHSVTVIATDERGQTTRVSRNVVPVKKPEIVRSEFVNGPVDSYHERIDPERYAAHHVLEIDLNGVDSDSIGLNMNYEDQSIRPLDNNTFTKRWGQSGGNILVHTYWAGKRPKEYDLSVVLRTNYSNQKLEWVTREIANFNVTPSKPELRLDVVNDGTKEYITKKHGILVNASGSFDPDGTELKYIWKYGAEPTKPDNSTAKFRSYERAASIVEDQYDLRTKRNFDFLAYFVPEIAGSTVLGDGPYYPNETVRVRVQTEPYHFSKQTYYDDFSLGLSLSSSVASIVRWEVVGAPESQHSEPTEDAYRYVGVVEIPVEELSSTSQSPTVTIYNEDNERKKVQTKLPEVGVLIKDSAYWSDLTIQHLQYLVEKHRVRKVEVNEKQRRDTFLAEGYHVEEVSDDTKYVLEKRVKVSDAKYETVTRTFPSRQQRELFLRPSLEWYKHGTVQQEVTRTREYTEWFDASTTPTPDKWHDSHLGNGEQTGATREVKVAPAEYDTLYQHRYEYEVQRTGTRTRINCNVRFGCRAETITYTYTVTKSSTYWSSSSYSYSGTFTGRTKQVKVDDAEYETQFEVRYRTQYTELVTHYEAAREKKIQKARHEWQERASTMDYMEALKLTRNRLDWRITEESVKKWTLARNEGTSHFWTPVYSNESQVVRTKAEAVGEFTKQYYNPKTEETVQKSKNRSSTVTYLEAQTRAEIIERLTSEKDSIDWCEMKVSCTSENVGS